MMPELNNSSHHGDGGPLPIREGPTDNNVTAYGSDGSQGKEDLNGCPTEKFLLFDLLVSSSLLFSQHHQRFNLQHL
jgi:hypothetical protein